MGNLKVDSLPQGGINTYVRDLYGRVTAAYDPLANREEWDYDALNRVTLHRRYTIAFLSWPSGYPHSSNRMIGCQSSYNQCTDLTSPYTPHKYGDYALKTYYYQGATGLDSLSDPRGVKRRYVRDARGLTITEKDEFNRAQTATLDQAGLVTSMASRDSLTVSHTYDLMGRRTKTILPPRVNSDAFGSYTSPADTIQYTYDGFGNLIETRNRNSLIRRGYYADGSLRKKVTILQDTVFSDSIAYSYNETGAISKVVYAGKDTMVYGYDAAGDLATMAVWYKSGTGNVQKTFAFDWDTLGRRKRVGYPESNLAVELRYGRAGELRWAQATNTSSATDNRHRFTWEREKVDLIGRIQQSSAVCPGTTTYSNTPCAGSHGSEVNRYNQLGMLTSQQLQGGQVDSMRYDDAGNLAFKLDANHTLWTVFVMGSGTNRLTSDHDSLWSGPTITHTYTGSGARRFELPSPLIAQNIPLVRAYYYDALGRMTGMMKGQSYNGGVVLTDNEDGCRYDADGQMFLPCDETGLFLTFDGANPTAGYYGGNNRWRFFHGPGLDDPMLAVLRGTGDVVQGQPVYVVTDGQGRQLSAGHGDGSLNADEEGGSTLPSQWRFAGATKGASSFDPDRFSNVDIPDVSLFRNRAYDARTGRWTQEDPIGVGGGLNLFQFNGNDPVRNTDPFGLCPIEKDGIPCTFTMAGAGLLAGGLGGAVIGATGGTFVVPGVGTVAGGGGGALVGGTAGVVVGGMVGAARDISSVTRVADGLVAEMASAGDWLRRILIAGAGWIGGGVPDRVKGSDNPPEFEEPAKPPKPDETKPDEDQKKD